MPSSRPASATAAAWLPAEQVTTPRARSSGVSSAMRENAPRTLNAPVRWNSSALSQTPSPSDAQLNTGVRRTWPWMTPAARRTSSIVTGSSAMPRARYSRSSERATISFMISFEPA